MEMVHLTALADDEGHRYLDVPESMKGRSLKVTLSLNEEEPCDANGWPIGFKERFLGAFPEFPDIKDQPAEDVEPIR